MNYSAIAHLNTEKAPQYRAVLEVFRDARERFAIALGTADVQAALGERIQGEEAESSVARTGPEEISALLDQLVAWGNLVATCDTTDVATVEEFFRPRYLYQLTLEGEAAEQALAAFHEHLHKPGELQTTALRDIITLLDEIESARHSGTRLSTEQRPRAGRQSGLKPAQRFACGGNFDRTRVARLCHRGRQAVQNSYPRKRRPPKTSA